MTVEEILAALQAILDAAKNEDGSDRTLTDEEVRSYEALEAQLASARKNVEVRARQQAYTTPVASHIHVGTVKQDDTLERAFDHYMRTGKENQDIVQLRAQSVGTDTAGGFLVPETFRQKLVERLKNFGGIAAEAEVITTSGGEDMRWPTLDDTANEGAIAAEGVAGAGGADLVFGEKTLNAFKYVAPGTGALPLRVSVELLADSAFDVQSLVQRKLAERIARKQAEHWAAGTGTGMPDGLANGAADLTFATGSVTTVDKDDIINLLHTLDPDYRANAVWVINDSTLKAVRKLEDTTGRPLWEPFATSGLETVPGGLLLGHRVVIDQDIPSMAASAKSWIFGDIRESYVIRRVQDVTLIVNPFSRANEGQVEYTLWARADGTVQNDNSFVIGANAAV